MADVAATIRAVAPDLGTSSVRRFGSRTFDLARHVVVMAIVNRTADSFYDKGRTLELGLAVDAAVAAVDEGAEWVDFGAVPFSPIAEPVSEEQEIRRLLPLVEEVRSRTDAVISVDTYRAEVARVALGAGADVVNDVSGLADERMAEVVAGAGGGLVVTHSKARPREVLRRPTYADVVSEVRDFLLDRAATAVAAGVAPESIVIDPGHDLNKNTWHSLELTRRVGELAVLGFPLLCSVSNKDFISETLDSPSDDVVEGTIAAAVLCALQGARVLRVHNVSSVRRAVNMFESVQGWRPPDRTGHNLV